MKTLGICSGQPEALAAEGVRKRITYGHGAILDAKHRPMRICSAQVLNRYAVRFSKEPDGG